MKKIFTDKRLRILWTLLRIWLGYSWLKSGWGKVTNPAWVGRNAGSAISGFFNGVLAKASAEPPTVQAWYGNFIENFALPNAKLFSYLIAFGELLAGVTLIFGILTVAALLGSAFMNLNFLFAGTVSTNPIMYTAAILLLAAGANAYYFGLDRFILPKLHKLYQSKIRKTDRSLTMENK